MVQKKQSRRREKSVYEDGKGRPVKDTKRNRVSFRQIHDLDDLKQLEADDIDSEDFFD